MPAARVPPEPAPAGVPLPLPGSSEPRWVLENTRGETCPSLSPLPGVAARHTHFLSPPAFTWFQFAARKALRGMGPQPAGFAAHGVRFRGVLPLLWSRHRSLPRFPSVPSTNRVTGTGLGSPLLQTHLPPSSWEPEEPHAWPSRPPGDPQKPPGGTGSTAGGGELPQEGAPRGGDIPAGEDWALQGSAGGTRSRTQQLPRPFLHQHRATRGGRSTFPLLSSTGSGRFTRASCINRKDIFTGRIVPGTGRLGAQ